MSCDVPTITLRAPSAAAAGAARYFSVRLRKTSASKAALVLTDVTALVARYGRTRARAADAKRASARAREAHASSFVFHEIGNLSTGLYGVLDQCRDAAQLRTPPPRAALESFEVLLGSMRDVLQNMKGLAQLSSGQVHFVNEVRRARSAQSRSCNVCVSDVARKLV